MNMTFHMRQKRALYRRSPTRTRPRAGARNAFTAVELMVAVVVLAMMITMVSQILASCKRLVSSSQAKMRANSTASAITDVIRDDLRRTSKNGVLCITQVAGGGMRLALAVPGTVQSLTSDVQGTGEFVCYGLVDNKDDPASTTNDILFRAGWIMNKDAPAGADVWRKDFAVMRRYSRAQINSGILAEVLSGSPAGALRVPPVTLADIGQLWQVASANCSDLTIQWSDGTLDGGNLKWYGPASPKSPGWASKGPDDKMIEFASEGNYRALWTQHNQSNWPKAIKFRFRLRDPDMPAEFSNIDYEVVCPIGQ